MTASECLQFLTTAHLTSHSKCSHRSVNKARASREVHIISTSKQLDSVFMKINITQIKLNKMEECLCGFSDIIVGGFSNILVFVFKLCFQVTFYLSGVMPCNFMHTHRHILLFFLFFFLQWWNRKLTGNILYHNCIHQVKLQHMLHVLNNDMIIYN